MCSFEQHDDRYARTSEWLDVVDGVWSGDHFSYSGKYYRVEDNVLQPKPLLTSASRDLCRRRIARRKNLIAEKADAYLTHGDPPQKVAARIQDMRKRRKEFKSEPLKFGVAGYAIVRETEKEAQDELGRITDVRNPRPATRTTNSGSPERSSSSASRWKTIRYPTAACAAAWSAPRSKFRKPSPPSKPPA